MTDRRRSRSGSSGEGRELVVIVRPEAGLRATREGLASAARVDASPLTNLLQAEGATLRPLFGANEERLRAATEAPVADTGQEVPDLSTYYRAEALRRSDSWC